jgi:cellulose synthase/poly-beta-1,6-N-acetylglucosamine synthase-like glycosyltransferase
MYLVEIVLFIYFSYVSLYAFVLSIAGLAFRRKLVPRASTNQKMAVLIPAYKEDEVITAVAQHAFNQTYPTSSFDVVVIADSLKPSTLEKLRSIPVRVVEVMFEKSTKVKALNKAMEAINDDYDIAVILDADNIMERNFLSKINDLFAYGYKAVQGKRDPKNENTSMALLDGLSETINNFIYRQGTVSIGGSASLNGSGMAFQYDIYKKIMAEMDSVGGFDRELELKLMEQNIKVYFAQDAIVYDEKVATTEVFERQRKRWISSQFFYLNKYFKPGVRKLAKGDFSFFNSSVLRNVQLPRLLNLGLLIVVTLASFVLYRYVTISPGMWSGVLLINLFSILFAIPRKFYSFKLLKSVFLIPKIFLKMFMLMFKLKGANKTFIHTPHAHIETHHANTENV